MDLIKELVDIEFCFTMPSYPWGSRRTSPSCLTHLSCPQEINWSMIGWAVLAKSPNWASQRTRQFGSTWLKPTSNPTTITSRHVRDSSHWFRTLKTSQFAPNNSNNHRHIITVNLQNLIYINISNPMVQTNGSFFIQHNFSTRGTVSKLLRKKIITQVFFYYRKWWMLSH